MPVPAAGEGFSSSWLVESIVVEQPMTGLDWEFPVNEWVRGGGHGGKVVRPGGEVLSRSEAAKKIACTERA